VASGATKTGRPAAVLVLPFVSVLLLVVRYWHRSDRSRVDFHLYMAAAKWWRPGNLTGFRFGYNGLRFSYPPFALFLFKAISVVPSSFCEHAWLIASAGAGAAVCWLGARTMFRDDERGRVIAALVAAVGIWSAPVMLTARLGQVNTFLALAVVADLFLIRRRWRFAGVLTGVATAIKLTPVFAIAALFVLGRRSAAMRAAATAAIATATAALVSPVDSWNFWYRDIYETARIGSFSDSRNQSITGLLSRTLGESASVHALALVAGVTIVAIALWRASTMKSDEVAAISLVMVAGSLVVPVSWVHHLLFAVLVVVALLRTRPLSSGSAVIGVALAALLFVPDDSTAWLSSARTLVMIAAVLALAAQVSRYPLAKSDVPNTSPIALTNGMARRSNGRGSMAPPTIANTGKAASK
jgi:alpha-1,2-mannosyltransferase